MISEETIRECETKALQALASVVYDLAGDGPEGETPEGRIERFNAAGRFLYEMLLTMAQHRAALMTVKEQAEADMSVKQ
jgi:hypothetical protein